jgi:HPt (histidine-containing phosphotransfer) domain-containing protein
MDELKTVTKFKFSADLDQNILEQLYGDDLHYAASIFEIFIEYSLLDFKRLQVSVENSDWEEISQLAHKLKPTFPMVGLTKLEEKLQVIEQNAVKKMSYDIITKNLEEVAVTLENYIPILQSEYDKMREYLSRE